MVVEEQRLSDVTCHAFEFDALINQVTLEKKNNIRDEKNGERQHTESPGLA